MNYQTIKHNNISNGEGVRTSLFVTGCIHGCKGCFNHSIANKNAGHPYTIETENEIIESLKLPYIKGLSLLGGEPFMDYNVPDLIRLCQRVRKELPTKTIWAYSGYTIEELAKDKLKLELLSYCDVLVDGKFIQDLYSPKLKFRGSSNQRIIKVQETLMIGDIILHEKQY